MDDLYRDEILEHYREPHNFGTLVFGPPFLRTLGSKNRFSATSCDQLPLMMASYFMYGHQLLFPVPDVDRTDYLLVLGANPAVSNGSLPVSIS